MKRLLLSISFCALWTLAGCYSGSRPPRIGTAAPNFPVQDAERKGVLVGAEPLAPTATATTVRKQDGRVLVTDGPFAETKEQLAGYYIINCENLDEAIAWAAKIPTGCQGKEGCIEIRPMRGLGARPDSEGVADHALS